MHLTENQLKAIEQLSIYKYLTSSQLNAVGVYKNRGDLTNSLKKLVDAKNPLIGKISFGIYPRIGKLEDFYYLTTEGKSFLIENLNFTKEQIKAVHKNSTEFHRHYFHRKYTIDFHIYLKQWLTKNNGEVIFLDYYFDKTGNNRSKVKDEHLKGINRMMLEDGRTFIPDAVTKFNIDGTEYLYLFEQHNGNDVKRLFEQLYIHCIALSQGVVTSKYNFEKSHRVAIVFERESVKTATIKRLQALKEFIYFYNYFIFKTNDEIKNDFCNNWMLIDGSKVGFTEKKST
jgi:hypothetical protein